MTDEVSRHEFDLLRQIIMDGFAGNNRRLDEVTTYMRDTNGRVGKVEGRILVIETERQGEAQQAVKRGAWAGILAAAGLSGLIEGVKLWTGK